MFLNFLHCYILPANILNTLPCVTEFSSEQHAKLTWRKYKINIKACPWWKISNILPLDIISIQFSWILKYLISYSVTNYQRVWVWSMLTLKTSGWLLFQNIIYSPLQWHHNELDVIWNHQHLDCLLNYLFRCRSKKISKLRVTGFCEGNSPVTSEFPAQRAINMENVSIWWHHHASIIQYKLYFGMKLVQYKG